MNLLNGKITVLNYEMSPCSFPSDSNPNSNGVYIEGREEGQEYIKSRVLWDDIESENTKSDLFRNGRLRFLPEEEDEVYSKLGIEDRENIKTDKELMEQLLIDNIENIKKINAIKSSMLISRMKSLLFQMERIGKIAPHKIISVIIEKDEELRGGKRSENSIINQILNQEKKQTEENNLRQTIDNLFKEVQNLKTEKENTEKQSQTALQDLLAMVQQLKAENESLKNEDENKGVKTDKQDIKETKTKKTKQ